VPINLFSKSVWWLENNQPIPIIRGYGIRLRCPDGDLEEALDPTNNEDAVILMKRRIQLVTDECKGNKCTDTDIYIAAALAQNGPGFSHIRMQAVKKIKPERYKLYARPDLINRDWFLFFDEDAQDHNMVNTKTQLNRFDLVISELRSRRWIVPFLDYADIDRLKNWPVNQ
jgi:hypothetical protein